MNNKSIVCTVLTLMILAGCGVEGPRGFNGADGATGPAGADATPVVPQQLCAPSFVPSYPNTFPEYALCIQNKLYGVYSSNGGFLAELPIGVYSSDGINASCTFTIKANCVVQD